MRTYHALVAALALSHAGTATAKSELWVYTSIYKEFAAPLEAAFEKAHPDIDAQVFQAGSEKIQAKVEAELLAKKPQADIMLTSDPFWSVDLERRGLAHARPKHNAVETNYYSLMVLIAHKNVPAAQRPQAFADLTKTEFKNLIQAGSPLESGTMFSTVAYLSRKYGWEYFEKLRANNLASNGGNSTVIQKVESGEKKIGIVLLENALAGLKRGSPIEIIYPSDGAIPIPSVQVILKDAKNKANAEKFADFVLSETGQTILRGGFMYAVHPKVPAPEGAKPLSEVTAKSTAWTPAIQGEVAAASKDIKKKFAALVLE
jgi:iron(III) transport system substrate-binding protein